MDEELHQLCKEVWNKTGWELDPERDYGVERTSYEARYGYSIIYTSDYLLEKLPLFVNQEPKDELSLLKTDTNWGAGYYRAMDSDEGIQYLGDPNFTVNADTPLKALLKLVIALHDAGVKL